MPVDLILRQLSNAPLNAQQFDQNLINLADAIAKGEGSFKTFLSYADLQADYALQPDAYVNEQTVLILADETQQYKASIYVFRSQSDSTLKMDFANQVYTVGLLEDTFVFDGFLRPQSVARYFATYADIDTSKLESGDVCFVANDETKTGRRTIYRFEREDVITLDFDFTQDSYKTGNLDAQLLFVGYDDPQIVPVPATSADPGRLGELAIGTNTLYFHDGTQWLSVTGTTF